LLAAVAAFEPVSRVFFAMMRTSYQLTTLTMGETFVGLAAYSVQTSYLSPVYIRSERESYSLPGRVQTARSYAHSVDDTPTTSRVRWLSVARHIVIALVVRHNEKGPSHL
jgi:hypothetical protein